MEYKLEKIEDFLAIPEDRFDDFLVEFKEMIDCARGMKEVTDTMAELVGAQKEGCFSLPHIIWKDDGKRDKAVTIETIVGHK